MRLLIFLLCLLFSVSVFAQELKVGKVYNDIKIGNLAGNRNLAFGFTSILEEVIQDQGYYLNPFSDNELTVNILFFDVIKNNLTVGVYGRKVDVYTIIVRAQLLKNGKKVRTVTAKSTSRSISTSTIVLDQGGKFSQASVSNAIKKVCEQLINKLKL